MSTTDRVIRDTARVIEAVAAGEGVGVVSSWALERHARDGVREVRLDGDPVERCLYLVLRRDADLAAAATTFVALVREQARSDAGRVGPMPVAPAVAVSDDVREAVAAGRPVVALETTIITHGLPRPRNVTTALAAEQVLREAGVMPATIGVVDGRPTVGLSGDDIERLGAADAVHKIGTRDLPVAMTQGWSGGTTVAATALLAHRAGVGVFATGGLGGVHRGAATTFDESADLVALAGLPILVVSAGVKSILDVGATLERLETLGVTVLGYRTDAFPGFYVRDSGFPVGDRVETPAEVAAVVRARDALGLRSAVLLANPVGVSEELDDEVHRAVLDGALSDAATHGVRGKDTTPHLLDHLHRASGGRSLEVNVALYRANVALGGEVAGALAVPAAG